MRTQQFIDKPCRKCGSRPAWYYATEKFIRGTCVKCDDAYRVSQWQRFSGRRSFWDPPFKILDRACTKCGERPAWYAIHASSKDGYRRDCVECQVAYRLQFYRLPKQKQWRREYHQQYGKAALRDLKQAVFGHYGMSCKCCGENTSLILLTIDHVDGQGAKHRREIGVTSGFRFYIWLRDNGWPAGYQTLCWTCNSGRHFNGGICPHEEERLRLVA